LPHFDRPSLVQFITFRLHDSLPADRRLPRSDRDDVETRRGRVRQVEAALDSSYGACYLADSRIASIVEKTLLAFDGIRYDLLAWVIMPNHAHLLVRTKEGHPLSVVMQSWKSYSAKEANRILGRSGRFWQPEYFDRVVQEIPQLRNAVEYIHGNPVKAGLIDDSMMWRFSSARRAGGTPALRDLLG
jgi:putative DNA methylase